jgi:hypothetical protein
MPKRLSRISFTVLVFSVFMVLVNCRAADKNLQENTKLPEAQIHSRLGKKYTTDYNTSGRYALCRQLREADHSLRKVKYVVVRLSDQSIVLEGSFQGGHVKWFDEKSIEVIDSSVRKEGEKKIIAIPLNQF